MFPNRTIHTIQALLIVLLVTGCTSSYATPLPSATSRPSQVFPTETLTPTHSPTPTDTATVTATNLPTFTPSLPTLTLSPTLVPPTPTQTLTPAPTLSYSQQEAYLSELLKNNAGCKLPCWWGITPGVTKWETVPNVVLPISEIFDHPYPNGIVDHRISFDCSSTTTNDFDFFEDGGVVQGIKVFAVGYEDKAFFRGLWKSYSPEQILATYGQPTDVYVGAGPGGGEGFGPAGGVILKYDDEFLIEYSVKALEIYDLDEPMYRLCPSWQDIAWGSKIRIFLKAAEYPMSIEEFIETISSLDFKSYSLPIAEAAGISAEEFYRRFLPGGGPACLDTPQALWK